MGGSVEGGKKAYQTNTEKYGKDFMKKIGALGGEAGNTGGFAGDKARARAMGAIGGRYGRRGYKFIKADSDGLHYIEKESGNPVVFPNETNSKD